MAIPLRGSSHGAGPMVVRVPGLGARQMGLGDVIKKATSTLGIEPCGGCSRRADALNRRVQFVGEQDREK